MISSVSTLVTLFLELGVGSCTSGRLTTGGDNDVEGLNPTLIEGPDRDPVVLEAILDAKSNQSIQSNSIVIQSQFKPTKPTGLNQTKLNQQQLTTMFFPFQKQRN